MGLSINDVLTHKISLRFLYIILTHLPDDSAVRKIYAPTQYGWDRHAFMLADIYDLLQAVALKDSKRKKKITPYPRPTDKPKDNVTKSQKTNSLDRVKAFVEATG